MNLIMFAGGILIAAVAGIVSAIHGRSAVGDAALLWGVFCAIAGFARAACRDRDFRVYVAELLIGAALAIMPRKSEEQAELAIAIQEYLNKTTLKDQDTARGL